jgi:hypothetical protein
MLYKPSFICGSKQDTHQEFYLVEYKAVWSAESLPTFRKNMSPSSESKNKPTKAAIAVSHKTELFTFNQILLKYFQ